MSTNYWDDATRAELHSWQFEPAEMEELSRTGEGVALVHAILTHEENRSRLRSHVRLWQEARRAAVNADRPFQPGDTVRYKSGGPVLTVELVRTGRDGGTVYCHWWDGEKGRGAEWFKEGLLVKCDIHGCPVVLTVKEGDSQ